MYITYSSYKKTLIIICDKDISDKEKELNVIKSNIIKNFLTYVTILKALYTFHNITIF